VALERVGQDGREDKDEDVAQDDEQSEAKLRK